MGSQLVRRDEGLNTAEVAFGKGIGHASARDFVGLTVDGGGRGDDVATVGEQINALPFHTLDVEMVRELEVEVRELASGRADGMGFSEVGMTNTEVSEDGFRVEVEDDEVTDMAGDDSNA